MSSRTPQTMTAEPVIDSECLLNSKPERLLHSAGLDRPTAVQPGSTGDSPTWQSKSLGSLRRQALLLAIGCVSAAGLCLALWTSARGVAGELDARRARAGQVARDAQAIVELRQRPRHAGETSLARSDLLTCVAAAMQVAGLEPGALVSTLPQPLRRVPDSPHAEATCRLVFENVGLEPLIRCGALLTSQNPQLRVGGLQLRAAGPDTWDADLTLSYWLLAPGPRP